MEDHYPGVTLGAIALPHGLIQIDAPPLPEDGRSWRAALLGLNSGVERLLVNLDSHPDRTLGARSMDCTVLAHEKTAQTFRSRPNTFRPQGEETGADWEAAGGLGNIRWVPPEITFTAQLHIEWSNFPVIIEHHPGPASGACWAILPNPRIVFVGDLVVKDQPAFFGSANLTEWQTSLRHLMQEYKDYTIVSGRGGIVNLAHLQSQLQMLARTQEKLVSLSQQNAEADAVEVIVQDLMSGLNVSSERHKQYVQRLAHGLRHYYARNYLAVPDQDYLDE
jgi:glyoxylase-like metal-dependent hydrolase (beta-lactamase superfamily II)